MSCNIIIINNNNSNAIRTSILFKLYTRILLCIECNATEEESYLLYNNSWVHEYYLFVK